MLADESACVVLTTHALERMDERGILDVDVFRILRKGRLKGVIKPGNQSGDWVCTMADVIKGAREAGVVTAVVCNQRLVVITVEWEDLR